MLAVKPQSMDATLPDLRRFADEGSVFLSIAAGKTLSYFASHLGADGQDRALHAQHAGGGAPGHHRRDGGGGRVGGREEALPRAARGGGPGRCGSTTRR